MTPDIQQWLTEIKALQRQVADLRQERDDAYSSAANWRSLYETEARQRRSDIAELQATLADMQRQQTTPPSPIPDIARPPEHPGATGDSPNAAEATLLTEQLQAQVSSLSPDQLKTLLVNSLTELHHLRYALEKERADHAQTRQSLMGALGDTVDILTKERTQRASE